ncbi:MAG: CinA family protein [Chloroflexi bacterium]|nr:CinA family protein [Chloroflexota bacterium]
MRAADRQPESEDRLFALAERVGARLTRRGETVAVAESSAGGLISAALLAVPGASAYFRGGAVVYTTDAKMTFLRLDQRTVTEPRAATEEHAKVLARGARDVLGATWGIGETGAAGPSGNRYGDAAGHACVGVAGPRERADTIETGQDNRMANMETFAWAALNLLHDLLGPPERDAEVTRSAT